MSRSLPPAANLELLRKQAKHLARQHKGGSPSCCDQLRLINRFKGMTDAEILAAGLKLTEAQHALAKDYGFESWKELKGHVLALASAEIPVFSTTTAWDVIEQGVKEVDRLPEDILSQVLGITVIGSLVRGDFVEGRSDVAICTLYHASLNEPWASPAHAQVRPCLDKHLGRYANHNGNPYGWDDVCVSAATLPMTPEQAGHHRIRALGIYYFDTLKYHKTVWGEDFTRMMPAPVDPKPLIPERVDALLARAEEIIENNYEHQARMSLLMRGAVSALSVHFGDEPSVHRDDITRRYKESVPEFPEKAFGQAAWDDYLYGDQTYTDDLPRPFGEYHAFLHATKRVIDQNPI